MTPRSQRVRPLTEQELTYQEWDRLWREQTLVLECTPFCYHGTPMNRRYPQDGCPWCRANETINECERQLNALMLREAS